jgi:hypothetical protein
MILFTSLKDRRKIQKIGVRFFWQLFLTIFEIGHSNIHPIFIALHDYRAFA